MENHYLARVCKIADEFDYFASRYFPTVFSGESIRHP